MGVCAWPYFIPLLFFFWCLPDELKHGMSFNKPASWGRKKTQNWKEKRSYFFHYSNIYLRRHLRQPEKKSVGDQRRPLYLRWQRMSWDEWMPKPMCKSIAQHDEEREGWMASLASFTQSGHEIWIFKYKRNCAQFVCLTLKQAGIEIFSHYHRCHIFERFRPSETRY